MGFPFPGTVRNTSDVQAGNRLLMFVKSTSREICYATVFDKMVIIATLYHPYAVPSIYVLQFAVMGQYQPFALIHAKMKTATQLKPTTWIEGHLTTSSSQATCRKDMIQKGITCNLCKFVYRFLVVIFYKVLGFSKPHFGSILFNL